jgi:predicted TIM-barrel fold metal-dependent hydrolase
LVNSDEEPFMGSRLCTILVQALILPVTLVAQVPVGDYHQHLFSPAAAALVSGKPNAPGIAARDLIALLDSAGIQHALVLSTAYTWGKASRAPVEREYEHVKAENDWTAQQVAQYPNRLRAFCSFNPLKPYALEELARCSKDSMLHYGLKLHFGNSDVDLANPQNVARVRKVFAAANRYRMAIVVHMRTSIDNQRKYGADAAQVFLNELLPAAPDVPVQIAHLAGSGGYAPATDSALSVFTDALARQDPRLRNVWFDASVVVRPGMSADVLQQVAARIRQIGVGRVLYGSDAAGSPLTYPKAGGPRSGTSHSLRPSSVSSQTTSRRICVIDRAEVAPANRPMKLPVASGARSLSARR